MIIEGLLRRTLLIDLETTRSGRIRHVGAIINDSIFEKKSYSHTKETLKTLDNLSEKADYVLGHNLLGHDFPILQTVAPDLKILKKPVIDTLYLSPLAFPQNPYHKLVKDYKLVRSSVNDPVSDARLAVSIFEDQIESFQSKSENKQAKLDFFKYCFEKSVFNGFSSQGLTSVFNALGAKGFRSIDSAVECFIDLTTDLVCKNAAYNLVPDILRDQSRRPALAYCLAWLQVSGSNSVLPPWVRHRFPVISQILKTLRDESCGKADCPYCQESHNPDRHLKKFFGFASFREKPKDINGKSLQRAVVAHSMKDLPLIAILPTGGGKSLCYQLPGLIRHWRRGLLTVVISPLQALMKDQVDNLVKNTGTPFAEAIYGMLTPPERGEVLERVRLGDVAILYLAPEQLRSRSVRSVLKQREIGCWVFDEAHCLSKWGHDFRPDYLYAARFIREFCADNKQSLPPICGYTATAKLDVIDELTFHFRDQLDQELELFAGGVERENLVFEILPVATAEKFEQAANLLNELLSAEKSASAVVYAATRKKTEEIRDYLQHQGIEVEAFHGGLESHEKKDIIEDFVSGRLAVICATNAFGMGVDKGNIRLVLHFDMPGSLENYIQEAGRAGRDQKPARCVLLYDPEDANFQFGLGALSEVKKREIERILRALRRVKRNKDGEIVITSDELLRDEELSDLFDSKQEFRDTKVKTAISWLERSGFLRRNQNLTEVFQGKPLVQTIEEAQELIERLNLAPFTERLWINILRLLFNNSIERGLSADSIAEGLFQDKEQLRQMEKSTGLKPAQIVLSALHDMAEARLIDRGIMLSAILRPKGKNNAMKVLNSITEIERHLLSIMREQDPDADNGSWVELSVRRLNQQLKNEGYDISPYLIQSLIKGLSYDGKGLAASLGSLELKHIGRDRYQVRLQRSWDSIEKTVFLRHSVASTILKELISQAKKQINEFASTGGDVNISFSSNSLADAIKFDITLSAEIRRILPAIDRALMFLHENKAIHLQGGMAVLRQAMTIRMEGSAKGRRYTLGDFKPLSVHYREKRFQVHVMDEYATLGLEKIASALTLVLDYFSLGRIKFINKYFSDRKDLIEKAITQESYRKIVDSLGNPVQIAVVGNPVEQNMLILAGPGAGKTTVIVHRCAYLLQVERIPARQILVLCFNHNAAISLRKRINKLLGKHARGMTIVTYHGAAMRIAGISVRDVMESENSNSINFDKIIVDALKLLKGEIEIIGSEQDEVRDQLLGGFSHILVDEYQDIDKDQYELVSAIAGKSLNEGEGRLSILAVGDDDQNIYAFRGANVQFIRQFQKDYPSKVTYLVENYRSSKHIINVANQLIKNNKDRMKGNYPIRINRSRELSAPGGRQELTDPVGQGRVQVLTVNGLRHQAVGVVEELHRLKNLLPDCDWEQLAIISRTNKVLSQVRSVLEKAGFPVKVVLEKSFPIHRVREIVVFIDFLKKREEAVFRTSQLIDQYFTTLKNNGPNAWINLIRRFLVSYQDETSDAILPTGWLIDKFYEYVSEQQREKVIGEGIFLGTIHSAKGMEFSHVFVLDGDWNIPNSPKRWEEERRILYVAMTRAKESLVLMKVANKPNPFLKELKSQSVLPRKSRASLETYDCQSYYQYEILGLEDIFMDYAGGFRSNHLIHKQLSKIGPGDELFFVDTTRHVEVHDCDKCCVCRLAKKNTDQWRKRIKNIHKLRVLSILVRGKNDPDIKFDKWVKTDSWELPIIEAVMRD